MYFLVLNSYRYINKMCVFQYSSDMKSSENIKDKFKDFIDSRLQLQINGKVYNTQS